MRRKDDYLKRLRGWLIACDVPVRLVLWNPGLSPPVELLLSADATPNDHYRANMLLRVFDPFHRSLDERLDTHFRLKMLQTW